MSERVCTPISVGELERRWTAARAAMNERGVDVLVMQNDNDHMGGYVKYFCDMPARDAYPATLVFPAEGGMAMVAHGPFGGDHTLPAEGDGVLRGVTRLLTTGAFPSAAYCREYHAQLAAQALAPYASATIGLVGTSQLPYAFVDYLKRAYPSASFVEASDLVDRVKAVKSGEEIELIRRTTAIQDAAMEAAFDALQPGKRDSDVAAVAQFVCQELGSEQGLFLCASAPVGEPAVLGPRHLQGRTIGKGDVVNLLIESNGPGGFYAELGRTCVLGTAPAQLLEEHEFALEAQRYCVGLLRPGTPAAAVWESYNGHMRAHGRPEERRLHCHGQGYDLVERPLMRFDEDMTIQESMNITCHPTYVIDGMTSWICDNFLITAGSTERLHQYPQTIVER